MKDNKLEVGDRLYQIDRWSENIIIRTVTRLTRTQAVVERPNTVMRFPIEYRDLGIYAIGTNSGLWRIETPELKQQYKRQLLLAKVKQIDFKKLSDEILEQIIGLTNEIHNTQQIQ